MIKSASELRAAARASLSGKWGGAVIVTLVYLVLMGVLPGVLETSLSKGVGTLLQLVLIPMGWSIMVLFLDNIRSGAEYKVKQLFSGFRDYKRVLFTILLVALFTFLWMLLLIIPGIIKSYSYAMTSYVLRDEPDMDPNSVIERSMEMMKGHKFDLFYLQLTFIGWLLLSFLTLGVGLLWFCPYAQTATAHFYEEVKAEYEARTATCVA